MGYASGRLGTTGRRVGAGVLVLLATLLLAVLPAGAKDHGPKDRGEPPAPAAPQAAEQADAGDRRDEEAGKHGRGDGQRGGEAGEAGNPAAPAVAGGDGAPAGGDEDRGAAKQERAAAKQERHAERAIAKQERRDERAGGDKGGGGDAGAGDGRRREFAAADRRDAAREASKSEREPAGRREAAGQPEPPAAPAEPEAPAAASDLAGVAQPGGAPVVLPVAEPPAARARVRRAQAGRVRAARRRAAQRRAAERRAGPRPAARAGTRRRDAPQGRALARDHWVPAPAVAPAVAAAPAAPAAGRRPGPARPEPRAQPAERRHGGGALRVFPIVFDALTTSVAVVPDWVWIALGALGLLAAALAGLALARDRRARALARERATLIADLETLEGAVVPALPEMLGGLALSVTAAPALGPASGGDFHDAFALSGDRVAVLVGDVAGTGRQAIADAQLVRHAVRAYLEAGLDPRSAIAMTGAVVEERDQPLFASVLVAVHDRRDGTLTFATAGHEPPILVGEHGASLPPVSGWSPPLGAGLETGRRQTSLPLARGHAVCLITDGVTEARSHGERLGVSRVIAWLSALGPGAMSSDVVARVREEADGLGEEDVTVCMLRAVTPVAPDVPRIEEALVEGGDPSYLVRFLRDCGLPLADAEEAGAALAAAPDGARMIASVEIRGGRAVVELAPLKGTSATELLVG